MTYFVIYVASANLFFMLLFLGNRKCHHLIVLRLL